MAGAGGVYASVVVTSLLATILASGVAWGFSALLGGHISSTADSLLSFVVWAVVFIPTFVWVKKLRDGG